MYNLVEAPQRTFVTMHTLKFPFARLLVLCTREAGTMVTSDLQKKKKLSHVFLQAVARAWCWISSLKDCS